MKSSIVHECRTCDNAGERFAGSPCYTCSILHPDPLHEEMWIEHHFITLGRLEGTLQGRFAALGEAREICEKTAKKWANEAAETAIPENAVTFLRQKNTAMDCSDAIQRLRILGTL